MKGEAFLPVLLAALAPILVLTLSVAGIGAIKWQPPMIWSAQIGNATESDTNGVWTASLDSTGLYVGGFADAWRFAGNGLPPTSPGNAFASRYDLAGHQIWTRSFGDPRIFNIRSIAAGNDSFYMVGSSFVKKYDSSGNEVWTDSFVSSADDIGSADGVSVGSDGVYATGTHYFSSNASQRVELHAYDFQGKMLWTTVIGGGSAGASIVPSNVYAGPNGVYVSVYPHGNSPASLSRYNFNGTQVWTRQLGCPCYPTALSGDETGTYVAGGMPASTPATSAFVSKYDWTGGQLWTRLNIISCICLKITMSASSSGVDLAIAETNQGLLIKFDPSGNRVWSFTVPWLPYSIAAGENGLYVGGDFTFFRDAFLAEFTQSSSLIFFGINPPFSFLLLSGLIGGPIIGVFVWLRRQRASRLRPASTAPRYGSTNVPADVCPVCKDRFRHY